MKLLSFLIAPLLFFMAGISVADVNINTADVAELARELKNIGPAKASAIVEYRKMHGAFKTIDDLLSVQGIGNATLEMNRERIILVDPKPRDTGRSGVADSR